MKVLSAGWNTFHATGRYTCATVEYAGLFSYSMLVRSSSRIKDGVVKITTPVVSAVCWPYDFVKIKTSSIFSSKEHAERIKELTEQLAEIEKRLAQIEKYGAISTSDAAAVRKRKKELRDDKRFVLKGILEETKALKEEE